jgi:hypothetical protein
MNDTTVMPSDPTSAYLKGFSDGWKGSKEDFREQVISYLEKYREDDSLQLDVEEVLEKLREL